MTEKPKLLWHGLDIETMSRESLIEVVRQTFPEPFKPLPVDYKEASRAAGQKADEVCRASGWPILSEHWWLIHNADFQARTGYRMTSSFCVRP